jgi:hypothetical protein
MAAVKGVATLLNAMRKADLNRLAFRTAGSTDALIPARAAPRLGRGYDVESNITPRDWRAE